MLNSAKEDLGGVSEEELLASELYGDPGLQALPLENDKTLEYYGFTQGQIIRERVRI